MANGRFFIRWTWADGFIERAEAPRLLVYISDMHLLILVLWLGRSIPWKVEASARQNPDLCNLQ